MALHADPDDRPAAESKPGLLKRLFGGRRRKPAAGEMNGGDEHILDQPHDDADLLQTINGDDEPPPPEPPRRRGFKHKISTFFRIIGLILWPPFLRGDLPAALAAGMATTIGVIGTDAQLDKAQCTRLAQCGHDGLARSIDPVHTQFDGDTLFALATGASGLPGHPVVLGALAAHVVAQAVLDAVRQATGLPQFPPARDLGWN